MILRAKWVVDRRLQVHRDGTVDTGKEPSPSLTPTIERRTSNFPQTVDLGDSILLPGLVNAHCHLDYTDMCGKIPPSQNFADWINEINRRKRSWTEADFSRSIVRGLAQALSYGTTTMANWVCSPPTVAALPAGPPISMRIEWLWEQIALRDVANPKLWDEWHSQIAGRSPLWRAGLAPHAPYSCRAEVIRAAAEWSAGWQRPWSIHVAESAEEFAMFHESKGPLFELFHSLGRSMDDCGKTTPFGAIWQIVHESETPVLLIHANHLDAADFALLSADVARPASRLVSVVHCPRSHAYFGREKFPLQKFSALGVNVCLGTDSLASNRDLSMFAEMGCLVESQPQLRPQEIVSMATLSGARSLGMEREWFQWQDWIAIPAEVGNAEDVWSAIVHFTGKPTWIMVDGQITDPSAGVPSP